MNGIPKFSSDVRNVALLSAINKSGADIVGIAEHNCNFRKFRQCDQWHTRVQNWWESSKSVVSTNQHDTSTSPYLPGGTITLAINKASHRVQTAPKLVDDTGMGRWSSILFRGSHGVKMRTITAYRVCKQQHPGPSTSASQQHRHMLANGDDRHARDAIIEDLHTLVTQYHMDGEQVVLLMDCNEDVRSPYIKNAMRAMGLREAITEERELSARATHQHNQSNTPIDGAFISDSLIMLRGGYLPFGEFDSDHGAIWLDFANANLFGFKIKNIPRHPARRMKCDLPWVKQKFMGDYRQRLRDTRLPQRIFNLQNRAMYTPWNQAMSDEFNDIMDVREKAILSADGKCRKLCMGHVEFSDSYDKASKSIELWRGVIKRKQGKRFSTAKIRSLARYLGIARPNDCTLEEAIRKKDMAFTHYHTKVKKQDTLLRKTFLQKKAEQLALESNQDQAKVLQQLQDRENLRKSNRRIDWTLEKHKGIGVTKISVDDHHGNSRDITHQTGIEAACLEEFESKFRQTESTPSMQEPWLSILGYNGKTQGARDILNGSLQFPDGTSEYTKDFFRALQREPTIQYPAPSAIMTTTAYQQGWKKMKERTSAGLSGITFGHMKACSEDKELADFEATVSHLPYSTGFVPDKWKQGVCCMLPKKANSDNVKDLRTIVLQECEYNFNNKKLGKDAMHHAERNGFLAPEQYGGRKGKRSIDHVLNKRLTYDLIRLSRRPAAVCSNDAKSCYDRVLHSIVSLAFRRMGFPEQPIDCMISCIQQMKYFIRTTFGTSTSYFSSATTAIPLQGLLQGNGAGPTIWVIVSTPLLNMLRKADMGAHLLSSISKEAAHFVGFAFVDDTDLVTFRAHEFNITADEIFEEMQESIDRWEEGLTITGGAIVPSKSWVYPIAFDFLEDGRWKYKSQEENDFQFSVKDHTGTRQVLQQHDVHIGKETLGAILAPDGNNRAAVRKLRQKSDHWYSLIQAGHLQPDETFMATNSRIMKSLTYCLPAMTFTEKECKHILAPVLKASLPKSRISSKFPHAVVFGPITHLGIGYSDLFTIQGVAQLQTIVQYLQSPNDITGKLLRANLEAAKVDIGLGNEFFRYEYKRFSKHLTPCWVKSVWEFVDTHPISFSETMTGAHALQRNNDQYIMLTIIQLNKYGQRDLLRLNACRLYLQAFSLSDLTTGDGIRFTNEAWTCLRDTLRRTPLVWPAQRRPNAKSRKLWRQALKLSFPRNQLAQFLQPLGHWSNPDSRAIWTWFFNPVTSFVYKRFGQEWKKYKRSTQRGQLGRYPKLIYDGNAFSLPPQSLRATVEVFERHHRLTGWTQEADTPQQIQQSLTARYRRSIAMAVRDMKTDHRHVNCNAEDFIQQLRTGSVKVVSDGSYLQEATLSTAAWILALDRNRYIVGRHQVTGNAVDQCSHRGELSGLLGGVTDVNALCLEFNIDRGRGQLYCDGLGAVSIATYIQHKLSPSHPHFDIINALFCSLQDSPLAWSFHHVYGHQDNGIELRELSDEAYYNTLADQHAKNKLTETLTAITDDDARPSKLPYRLYSLTYATREGTVVSIDSKFGHTLSTLIRADRIQQYWVSKGVYPSDINRRFNNLIAAKAMRSLPGSKRRWISKWCTGIFGNGITMQRWKQQDHSNCPRCHQPQEDAIHILTCQHISATGVWDTSILDLHNWMLNSKGHPELCSVLCSSLTSWRNNTPFDIHISDIMRTTTIDQHQLGWERLFYGIWSNGWVAVQSQHLQEIGSRKSALLWLSKVQSKIWMMTFALWEHRNTVLHNVNNSVYPQELTAINGEIIQEMHLGAIHLPNSQRYLFHGTIQEKLRWNISMKVQWLLSARGSRNHFYALRQIPLPMRQPMVTRVLQRWGKRSTVKL